MQYDVKMAENGRLVLPKAVREVLGVADGGALLFSVEGSEVRVSSILQSVRQAQDLYRQYAQPGHSVEGFLAERKAEMAQEA